MTKMIVLETRRSKGVHKADVSKFTKEEIKAALDHYNSNSYVAVKNYRTESMEIKFERMGAKGLVNYSLKTNLTEEDLQSMGFVKSEKGNYHLTQKGVSISKFDIEVKPPVKKISKRKEKVEKKVKAEGATKAPLPPTKDAKAKETADEPKVAKAEEPKVAKASLPATEKASK